MSPTFQEHILDDHQDELLRFIFRKVNCPDTAQDIFQDTYVRYTNYPEKNKIEAMRHSDIFIVLLLWVEIVYSL
jgi:DNA-directed RNA polymerase specialized sigma24 family protein